MLVTKQLLVATDFQSMGKKYNTVIGYRSVTHVQILQNMLCSAEERNT